MIREVGIVGCGIMGAGIAQAILEAGYTVRVVEANQALLDKGIMSVRKGLERSVKNGVLTDGEAAIGRLEGTLDIEDLKDRDLVIEAILEELESKKQLFTKLDSICPEKTVLASNTSSLSITEMAGATSRPHKLIGLHFFNPVHALPLVEVVRILSTNSEVLNEALGFIKSLGKVPIVAKDNPGFIVNLLLTPYIIGGIRAVAEGVASVQDIDTGMKLGCGHPMGPLMLADLIGLDTLLRGGNKMFEEYKDTRFAFPPLLSQMVKMGFLGKKAGKGFYDWADPRTPVPQALSF